MIGSENPAVYFAHLGLNVFGLLWEQKQTADKFEF